jgi:hypothetical protein
MSLIEILFIPVAVLALFAVGACMFLSSRISYLRARIIANEARAEKQREYLQNFERAMINRVEILEKKKKGKK